jgi:alcohol dehydrogenase class IV
MIGAFTFSTSQRIDFENGAAANLASHAASFLGTRPFLVTDAGIISLGLHVSCETALAGAGHDLARFTDALAGPPRSLVDAAVEAARAHEAKSVIVFGGGSSPDVARLVALLLGSSENVDEAWGIDKANLPKMASDAMKQTLLLVNSSHELDEMNAFDIYEAAL